MTEGSTRVYRTMRPEGGGRLRPAVGPTGRELGVRVGVDVHPDEEGDVGPGPFGMSVSPSLATLPDHRCPPRLRALHPGATGKDGDYVFRLGEGTFVAGPVAKGLQLRPDKPRSHGAAVTHGVLGPADTVALDIYERDLAATQDSWVVDETGRP